MERTIAPGPPAMSGIPGGMGHAPFVGRERELAELRGAFDAARTGRGAFYLVSGEPGIGKTRLAEQAASDAAARGFSVLWGRCWESGGAPAYWPWVQVLRAAVRARNRETLKRDAGHALVYLGQLVPEMAQEPDHEGQAVPGLALDGPDAARLLLFDAVQTVVAALAAERPLAVMLDDLHAADEASLLLLQYLSRELQQAQVLILGTHRDWEMRSAPALRRLLGGLARASRHLPLRGLEEHDVARFVEADRGSVPARSLVSAVHRTTGGNPFFLGEIVRGIQGRGDLDSPALLSRDGVGIPLRVREMVRRRFEPLSPSCTATLPIAALIGQEFDRVVLGEACSLPGDRLLAVLDEAVSAGVLVHLGGHRYAFSHGIIRETLCDGVPPGDRAGLHARIAGVLEHRSPADPDAHLGELAYHFGEAAQGGADPAKAIGYAQQAAQHAMARLAFEEAVTLLQQALLALDLDPKGDLARRGELLLSLGEAQRRAGEADAARETFAHAAAVGRRVGSSATLGRAALGFGGIGRERISADYDWIALLEEALAAPGDEDSTLRVRLRACLAMALYWSDSPERRDALSRDAVAMARRLGDPATLAFALDMRLKAIWGPGGIEERLASGTEIVSLARTSGDRRLELEGHRWRVVSLLELGDVPAVDREIAAVVRIAEDMREPLYRWQSVAWRSMRAALAGDFTTAESLAGEALAAGERVQSQISTPVYLGQVFGVRLHQGRLGELTDVLRAMVDSGVTAPGYRSGLAQAAAQRGDLALARRELDFLAAGGFACLPHDSTRLMTLVTMAEVAASVGDAERAATLHDELLPYEHVNVVVGPALGCFGAVSRYLGLLALTCGRLDDAERHLTAALGLNTRMGARAWVAHTQADLAAMLVRRGAPGDAARAAELRTAALQTAEELGMPLVARKVRDLDAPQPAARGGEPLPCRLLHEGDFWTVSFEGVTSRVRDAKGMRYLRQLFAHPGREFHVLALVADVDGPSSKQTPSPGRMSDVALDQLGMHRDDDATAGVVLDAQARLAYRSRLIDLEAERDEAEAANDPGRRARAEAEIAFLGQELSRAFGMGGRARRAGSMAERARVSVTRALRAAIDRLGKANPTLGRHLETTIRTGTFCSYTPDPRVPPAWQL